MVRPSALTISYLNGKCMANADFFFYFQNAMVSTDIGNICSVSNSYLRFDQPNSFFAAMSFGNCGYAFPCAMGAKLGAPERPSIAYVGDGAWGMSLNEVMTCVRENIPAIAGNFFSKFFLNVLRFF